MVGQYGVIGFSNGPPTTEEASSMGSTQEAQNIGPPSPFGRT